jgi:hypothetical protein
MANENGNSGGWMGNGYRMALLGAILMLSVLATALILAIEFRNIGPDSTPAISAIIGFFAPTIGVFLVLLHAERRANTNAKRINGHQEEIEQLAKTVRELLEHVQKPEDK